MILANKNLLNRFSNKHISRDRVITLEDNFSEGFLEVYDKNLSEHNLNILTANGLDFNKKQSYFSLKLSEIQKKLNNNSAHGYELVDLEIKFKDTKSSLSINFNEILDFQDDSRNSQARNTFEIIVDGEIFWESYSFYELIGQNTRRNPIQHNNKLTFLQYLCRAYLEETEKDDVVLKNFVDWLSAPAVLLRRVNNLYCLAYEFRADLKDVFNPISPNFESDIDDWFWRYGIIEFQAIGLNEFECKIRTKSFDMKKENNKEINLFGYFDKTLGLGISAQAYSKMLEEKGFQVNNINIEGSLSPNQDSQKSFDDSMNIDCGINVFTSVGSTLDSLFSHIHKEFFLNKINIGLWYWEIEEMPSEYIDSIKYVSEIWVASSFVKNVFAKYTSKPIHVVKYPIEDVINFNFSQNYSFPRNYYFYSFDFFSDFYRKNPLQLVELFKKFKNIIKDDSSLIIKTINSKHFPIESFKLFEAIQNDSNITWIDSNWPKEKFLGYIKNSNGYLSLHKSEGLGLGLLEAMALGVPTLATAYSGNLEFMMEENSYLVNYALEKVVGCTRAYSNLELKDSYWAKPNQEDALLKLIDLHFNLDLKTKKIEKGLDFLRKYYTSESIVLPRLGH